ncbi:MAG: Uxx-star family glutaredoxin-like (seleno)protein [Dehalococcoidia bacterium]
MPKILVYSTIDCGYSTKLMEELDTSGIEYEKINLSLYPKRWDEVTKHTDGQKISPVMIDGDKVTIGYNGLGCVY